MKSSRMRLVALFGLSGLLAVAGVLVRAVQMGAVAGKRPGSAARKTPAQMQPATTNAPAAAIHALTVSLHSGGEMLLTDSSGRRTGYDSASKRSVGEIPHATYANESIDDPDADSADAASTDEKTLDLRPPRPGAYTLTVYGTRDGAYDLEFQTASAGSLPPAIVFENVPASPGSRQSYSLTVPAGGGALAISGAFTGTQSGGLLSYASPLFSESHLPAGTTTFPILVFYGKQSVPSTFSAMLNDAPIGTSFHAAPGHFESVPLPLRPGRNVLVLSIAGTASGENVTARDQLIFMVGSE